MSDIPSDLVYTKSHEWLRKEDDGSVTIGITDHAQSQLGDLVFVELPEVGAELAADDACAVVESVKAASDVYAPLACEILGANEALDDAPEIINTDPYGDGWIMKVKVTDEAGFDDLMDANAYAELVAAEEH